MCEIWIVDANKKGGKVEKKENVNAKANCAEGFFLLLIDGNKEKEKK